MDIFLILNECQRTELDEPLYAPQQNNRKWQIFLIIASLGGGGWGRNEIASADVPVAPGAVYIHHEEEAGP